MNLKCKKLYPIYLLRCMLSKDNILDALHIRRKPRTIQLPITSRCNSRCQTCNVWKEKKQNDINPNQLAKLLSNDFFSEVNAVGINGGEITLVREFDSILDAVLHSCKKLRIIHIISNGLLPDRLLPLLKNAKEKCEKFNVKLYFALSVDGFGHVHEEIRGISNCFSRTKKLLDIFAEDYSAYAHNIMIGCTLSKNNIAYVQQTAAFFEKYPFYVQYHIAVPNKRIHTFENANSFYLISDDYSRMLGQEFFYGKFLESNWVDKYSYFCQYYFLKSKGNCRLAPCPYKFRDVTIDENLSLYLCATASEEIDNFSSEIKDIDRRKISVIENSLSKHCNSCVHYIYNVPTAKGFLLFISEIALRIFDTNYKYKYKI